MYQYVQSFHVSLGFRLFFFWLVVFDTVAHKVDSIVDCACVGVCRSLLFFFVGVGLVYACVIANARLTGGTIRAMASSLCRTHAFSLIGFIICMYIIITVLGAAPFSSS